MLDTFRYPRDALTATGPLTLLRLSIPEFSPSFQRRLSPPDSETELNVALLPRHPRTLPHQTRPTPIPTNPAPNRLFFQHNHCRFPFPRRIILPIQKNASIQFGRGAAWTTTMEYPGILVLWTYVYACVSDDGVLCR